MNFKKFRILSTKGQNVEEEIEVLFNLDHIVSIKPIRIASTEKILNGFWIRTTNGKKYRASCIPTDLLQLIGEQYQGTVNLSLEADDQPFQ